MSDYASSSFTVMFLFWRRKAGRVEVSNRVDSSLKYIVRIMEVDQQKRERERKDRRDRKGKRR